MSFSPLALWLLDPPHRRMRYVIMRADMASSAERAEPQSPSSEPAQSPDVQALSSDVQAVSSDVQALSSDVQAVSSDLQALPSNEQAVSPDEQALTPDQQALTPDQQALTPDEHAVSLDEHAVSLLEHAVSPEPTEAESEFLEVATEWILHNIIEAADIMAKTAKLKKNSQCKSLLLPDRISCQPADQPNLSTHEPQNVHHLRQSILTNLSRTSWLRPLTRLPMPLSSRFTMERASPNAEPASLSGASNVSAMRKEWSGQRP